MNVTAHDRHRNSMLTVLGDRKDVRYRRGVIQMARMAGVISQEEWQSLHFQIMQRKKEPALERG